MTMSDQENAPASTNPVDRPDRGHGAQPLANLTGAPFPTARTLSLRRNLAVQAARFALINARMMRMVLKGHH